MNDKKRWLAGNYRAATERMKERAYPFRTLSDLEVDPVYTADDVQGMDMATELGMPGEYPYTRGVHASMYRSKLWTMRMFAGLGTAEQTNERFRHLLDAGQTGLSTAFDLPTLMGYDSDHALSRGAGGQGGVAAASLAAMEVPFEGLGPEQRTASLAFSSAGNAIWAMYLAMAGQRAARLDHVGGTIQSD